MLLLDDGDELPAVAEEAESALATKLGNDGLRQIDECLRMHTTHQWQKVARIVLGALRDGGFDTTDETAVKLHVRRVIRLAEESKVESQGNLYQPRWSEIRVASPSGVYSKQEGA